MAELRFSRSLYTEAAVRAAAEAYAGLCSIAVEMQPDEIVAVLGDGVDQSVADAFANHALFETITDAGRMSAKAAQ
jgi:hypothetical protein